MRLLKASKLIGVFLLVGASLVVGMPRAALASNNYGQHKGAYCHGIKVDSNMSREQAIGDDSVVPAQYRDLHNKMRPYLSVVTVYYHGFDNCLHRGQIVVNKALVSDAREQFAKMLADGFPIQSVIPESKFKYVDEASMQANNSSNYRPERLPSGNLSEHAKGAAFDLNPWINPMIVANDDGTTTVDPVGATYDPHAKGALYKHSRVQLSWSSANYEWGGSWGDPNADPARDFFQVGYFDYQHFQPRPEKLATIPLPDGL